MTTTRRPRAPAPLAVLALLAVLAGCSTVVAGSPRIGGDPLLSTVPAASVTVPTDPPSSSTGGPNGPSPVRPRPPSSITVAPSPSPDPTAPGGGDPLPGGAVAGAAGAGDPYYPTAGNGGYQVDKYGVALTYEPATGQLDATATIQGTATAAQKLGRFNLDLQPDLNVSSVTVNQAPATFDHRLAELVITPAAAIDPSADITAVITYSGRPGMISSGGSRLGDGGWFRTQDGGALAAGQPFSASAWYPVNEHPGDPAAFSVTATVPTGWEVISIGTRFDGALPPAPDGMHSVRYDQRRPIASYLTTVLIGKLTFTRESFGGKLILNAFTATGAADKELAAQTPKVLAVLSKHFGPFPFDSYGGIYTGENLPFALETATRPVYAGWVDLDTVVHETAHQWYGDDVMISRWSDICINECFASYAPWLYRQDVGGADLDATWKQQMAQVSGEPSFWAIPLVDMGAGNEFSSVYDRGPLAIHALRREMGENAFADLLTGWVATRGGRNASFDEFEVYASDLAGKDLKPFVDAWFRGTVVPPAPYRTPPGLG